MSERKNLSYRWIGPAKDLVEQAKQWIEKTLSRRDPGLEHEWIFVMVKGDVIIREESARGKSQMICGTGYETMRQVGELYEITEHDNGDQIMVQIRKPIPKNLQQRK